MPSFAREKRDMFMRNLGSSGLTNEESVVLLCEEITLEQPIKEGVIEGPQPSSSGCASCPAVVPCQSSECIFTHARRNGVAAEGQAPFASSESADASDSAGGAMDEDDLFVGAMEIDDGGNAAPNVAGGRGRRSAGDDEDMSEVAEIMLNLKVSLLEADQQIFCRGGLFQAWDIRSRKFVQAESF